MPTRRALVVLLVAFLLYLFGNQTQVGWLYVMSALLAGMVFAAFFYGRRRLAGLAVARSVGVQAAGEELSLGEWFEGEEMHLRLAVQNAGARPALQARAVERCPLADPASEQAELPVFIPLLGAGERVQLAYQVTIYRRGVHSFPPLEWTTGAPFGFFQQRRRVAGETRVLVYPELRPLRRLSLLDRRPSVQQPRPKAGLGTEVLGIRPYRPGDSPRHIHWRSVARARQLISKEFADETQPGLTLALDLYPNPYPDPRNKHNPFEWSVKIAASVGDYAVRHGYPLHILADPSGYPAPRGPVTRLALLEYLARVNPTSLRPLGEILTAGPVETFLVVALPWPDPAVLEPLTALHRRGVEALVVVLDPATFPGGAGAAASAVTALQLTSALEGAGLTARCVAYGDDWRAALEPPDADWAPLAARGAVQEAG